MEEKVNVDESENDNCSLLGKLPEVLHLEFCVQLENVRSLESLRYTLKNDKVVPI